MIDFSEINQNEKYKVISINYEKENGIKFYENLENFKKRIDNKFIKYIYLMKIECMSILTMMMKLLKDMLVMKKLLKIR